MSAAVAAVAKMILRAILVNIANGIFDNEENRNLIKKFWEGFLHLLIEVRKQTIAKY